MPRSDAGRPGLPDSRTCFIVDSWRAGVKADGSPLPSVRSVHVYTDAPYLRLELNGEVVVPPTAVPPFGNAEHKVPFAPGILTAVALSTAAEAGTAAAVETAVCPV